MNDVDEYDTDLEADIQKYEQGVNKRKKGGRIVSSKNMNREKSATPSSSKEKDVAGYLVACQLLRINPSQSISTALSTTSMYLRHRCLGLLESQALAAALLKNITVESLDLEDNLMGPEGCNYLIEMLKENKTIKNLNLCNNRLGSTGAVMLGELLKVNDTVVNLNISNNNFNDTDGEILALGIEKNERIMDLNVSKNEFALKSAMAFGLALGSNNSIEILNFGWNLIRKKHSSYICTALKRNYCVTSLDFSWNGMGVEGSAPLCDLLRGNKYLRHLDVSNNRIPPEGAAFIAKGLKENDVLETLKIGNNPLAASGVLDLIDAIDSPQSSIIYLGFQGIPVTRKILYIHECILKYRLVEIIHDGLVEGEDLQSKKTATRNDPLKLLTQYLADKRIRPYNIFREYDKEKQYKIARHHFVIALKQAKVPLDESDYEKLLLRLDASGKELKLNYQRLTRGVKDQIKQNRKDEKRRELEQRTGTASKTEANFLDNDLLALPTTDDQGENSSPEASCRSTPSPTEDLLPKSVRDSPEKTGNKQISSLSKGGLTSSRSSISSKSSISSDLSTSRKKLQHLASVPNKMTPLLERNVSDIK